MSITPIDHTERQAALNPEKSFIVQAPAGSGKTELLTRRYLALLDRVRDPEEILAITFTRKAAAEMRSRILSALAPTHPLLDIPNRLRVQTIDSLCASLTRQLPILSGLGSQPDIKEDPGEFYQQAARNVLASLEQEVAWRPALMNLLLHLANDHTRAAELFCTMLARRDQWLAHVAGQLSLPDQRQILEQALQRAICDQLLRTKESVPLHLITELLSLLNINKLPDITIHDVNDWLHITESLLTQKNTWRKRELKKIVEQLELCENFRQHLQQVRDLPPAHYSDQQWQIITALLELLPVLVAELQLIFQEHGAVDYIEIASRALQALGDEDTPTDLTLRLDYKIQHILVDEFQDTSIAQWRLLERLTAGWQQGDARTLFLVGDPMQSIYRFRKAEVGLFLQARHYGIGSIKLEPLTLRVNFRSTPEIVEWINKTFTQLLPEQEDIANGAVPYSASVGATGGRPFENYLFSNENDKHGRPPVAPTINIHAFPQSEINLEPQKIASIIQQIQQTDPQNHIAILVRARTHLTEILPVLQQANIAYRAVEIETLRERPVIQDLLALTRALLHLADRVAWLAILRAPWCGLTLADLHALVGAQPFKTIWEQLIVFNDLSLSEEGKQRLQRVVPVLTHSIQQRRRQSLARWVKESWIALGGQACVLAAAELEDAQAFFNLLDKLEVGGDIADLMELEKQVAHLYSSTTVNARVEVMTIHKAKGLEFDTVILPGLHKIAASDDAQLLLTMERPTQAGTDLLVAPIKSALEEKDNIYDYLRSEEKKRAAYEATRLLYVAVTRAKKSLHLLATISENKEPPKNSLLAKFWPALEQDFLNNIVRERYAHSDLHSKNRNENIVTEKSLRRLPVNFVGATGGRPNFFNHLNSNLIITGDQLVAPTSKTLLDPARHIGTVTHRLLQQICLDGIEKWNADTVNTRQPFIQNLLAYEGVIEEQLTASATIVMDALTKTLSDPRGQWILNNQHQDSRAEYPLTAVIDKKIIRIIIDRTFVDENGVRWIIDYKTADYAGKNLSSFLTAEQELYRSQLEQYAHIIRLSELHPIKLGLYFPLLGAWREWELN